MSYPRENTRPFSGVGAANTAEAVTSVVPDQNSRIRLRYLVASYSGGTVTGGLLTITGLTDADVWEIDMPAAGTPLVLPDLSLQSAPGTGITVTLAAAGAGVIGKINGYVTQE